MTSQVIAILIFIFYSLYCVSGQTPMASIKYLLVELEDELEEIEGLTKENVLQSRGRALEVNEVEETCGEYLGTGFIIGGNVTKHGEIPYIAALGFRNALGKINYNCGGTLINRYENTKPTKSKVSLFKIKLKISIVTNKEIKCHHFHI